MMEIVPFNGWKRCIRLTNGSSELIITRDVGPRILRFGFVGGPNLFAELSEQQGGMDEPEWMIRGGHRLWVAPEAKPWSYELDNGPYTCAEVIEGGVRTGQAPGPLTGIAKEMEIVLAADADRVKVTHRLTNRGDEPVLCAGWAPTAMAPKGQAIVPLPEKISHTERVEPTQCWSLWGYTDLSDPRWTLGSRYILFRQNPSSGPNKLGMAHPPGWAAYQLEEQLFVKRFGFDPEATYPDGGCSFETFSNEFFLEIESLGPLLRLAPGESLRHVERWALHRGVPRCSNDAEVDTHVRPLVEGYV